MLFCTIKSSRSYVLLSVVLAALFAHVSSSSNEGFPSSFDDVINITNLLDQEPPTHHQKGEIGEDMPIALPITIPKRIPAQEPKLAFHPMSTRSAFHASDSSGVLKKRKRRGKFDDGTDDCTLSDQISFNAEKKSKSDKEGKYSDDDIDEPGKPSSSDDEEIDLEEEEEETKSSYSKASANKIKAKWVTCTDCQGIAYSLCPMPLDATYPKPCDILAGMRKKFKNYYGGMPVLSKRNDDLVMSFWKLDFNPQTGNFRGLIKIGRTIKGYQLSYSTLMPSAKECKRIELVRVDLHPQYIPGKMTECEGEWQSQGLSRLRQDCSNELLKGTSSLDGEEYQ